MKHAEILMKLYWDNKFAATSPGSPFCFPFVPIMTFESITLEKQYIVSTKKAAQDERSFLAFLVIAIKLNFHFTAEGNEIPPIYKDPKKNEPIEDDAMDIDGFDAQSEPEPTEGNAMASTVEEWLRQFTEDVAVSLLEATPELPDFSYAFIL